MRFRVDKNLSPSLAEALTAAGHDTIHVRHLRVLTATDRVVLERPRTESRVLISADTDFGEPLAVSGATQPSVILLRRENDRSATSRAGLMLDNLEQVAAGIDEGAIVVP